MLRKMTQTHRTPEMRAKKSDIAGAQHRDPDFARRYREGLDRRYSNPKLRAAHAKKTLARHQDQAFGRTGKMGIAHHWALKHLSDNRIDDAIRQIESLRLLVSEAWADPPSAALTKGMALLDEFDVALFESVYTDESRIKMLAQSFLEKRAA